MRVLFAATLFVGAALLFVVQPLLGRLVLPKLGGAPAVWNTCLVFFQAALLAGYAYAHALPARLGVRRHAALHLALLCLPFFVLPLTIPAWWPPPSSLHPVLWLSGLLLVTAGPPFLAAATTSPLLQRWFTHTAAAEAADPYFLYSASNLGSMVGLLAYPFLLEPTLTLARQAWLWAAGYGLLLLLTAACAACLWRAPRPAAERKTVLKAEKTAAPPPPVTDRRRVRWVLLAFAPSSLLLSVTTYLTTDVAPVPLLWVVPLALYLLTFVLSFARRPPLPPAVLTRWMPLALLPVVLLLLAEGTELPIPLTVAVHLLGLFWVGLVCHGELARDRPPGERLTEFYLWLSLGGVLGGAFNALLAPLIFNALVEYPLALVLACLLRPPPAEAAKKPPGPRARLWDWVLPAALGAVTAGLVLIVQAAGAPPGPVSVALMFAAPLVVCYTFLYRPVRFGLGVGALLLAGWLCHSVFGAVKYRERSFFAVHRVTTDPTGRFIQLVHGDTVHGRQDPKRPREPLTYYYRTGPIGQVFAALKGDDRLRRVGVVGLGAGALCCYAEKGQRWTFYEIDPAVKHIACDPIKPSPWFTAGTPALLFTFWSECPADCDVVLGDARVSLGRTDERFGVLVIDAFNSDAVPVHLLTRQALDLYFDRLTDDGVLAFNISNRYLDLQKVLADLAGNADPPLVCLEQEDRAPSEEEKERGKEPSHWVVMAKNPEALKKVTDKGGWAKAPGRPGAAVWTDDFSHVFGVLKWDWQAGDY